MPSRLADTLAIGVLAGLSCLLTAYLIDVPIWVVFITWAAFFAAGGGVAGACKSLTMTGLGIISAVATLLLAGLLGGSPVAVAGCVVVGAGALVAIRNDDLLGFTPAGFFGFAATVGTIAATGIPVDSVPSMSHPAVTVAAASVLGTGFGLASQYLGAVLTRRSRDAVVD